VLITSRSERSLTEAARAHPGLETFAGDLSAPSGRERLAQEVRDEHARAGPGREQHGHPPPCRPGRRWINRYDRERLNALADLKTALEDDPMTKPEFVYVTHIKTTPEKLWQALTEPAFTRRYWGAEFESDLTEGSPMVWREKGVEIRDPEQVVLVSDPYRRLSYTWHTFTAEWAKANNVPEETLKAFAAEPRSHVTFDIEPTASAVKLTVTHGGFEPGSDVLAGISNGWPAILSSLKTLLESGEPL
jgi:uncharacterized protein YndB with AHSA1/START domain